MNRRFTAARIAVSALILAAVLVLSSCGGRGIGYGVLLWSPDEEAQPSGGVYTVTSQSELNNNYTLSAGRDNSITVERWRVRLFETEEEADALAASMASVANLYAVATLNALPMRSAPDNRPQNNIVYRFAEGETLKIIGRDEETTDIGGLVSYWFQGMAEDGTTGYVFGARLRVFDPLTGVAQSTGGDDEDQYVSMLLTNVWRPIYFVDMISEGAYDLSKFQPEYGLFPDPENNQLSLVMHYHSTVFHYESITRVGPQRYLAEGTSLQLTFRQNNELSIQYLLAGQDLHEARFTAAVCPGQGDPVAASEGEGDVLQDVSITIRQGDCLCLEMVHQPPPAAKKRTVGARGADITWMSVMSCCGTKINRTPSPVSE